MESRYNIPEELLEIIPGYINRRGDDVQMLKIMISNRDFDAIRKLGHKLKGNGASFGFDRITDIGNKLMQSCEKKDYSTVANLINEFETEINLIKSTLKFS